MRPRGRTTAISWIVLGMMMVAPLSHSQPQPPRASAEPDMGGIMRRRHEEMDRLMLRQMAQLKEQAKRDQRRAVDESRRQSIGATPSQWRSIRPRLLAVESLHSEMRARLRPQISYSLTSGSEPVTNCEWIWKPLSDKEPNEPLTVAETACQTLRDMLVDEQTPIEAIWEQVERLRVQRKHAAEQAPAAEETLRKVATLRQEAALMAYGWLQ
jgi:hypothetical protein